MATKAEKKDYRYCDFYCFMSLADFSAYVASDDDGEHGFSISGRNEDALLLIFPGARTLAGQDARPA
ncbi:hypothetical protein [Arthrobacter sp. ISL-65]|uniref:hypothetical protein n=1 Tax=Arthrobacter sp. ISL-65 TaxID=2819112 RepID=UPI001BEBDE84|nr:hypothetical protein [Arthrobacter sp. ISL-65]MBT2549597.1 hypothetical protein [Arthrobacter sp. ISL-65]